LRSSPGFVSIQSLGGGEPIDNARHIDEKIKLDRIKAERLAEEAAKAAAAADERGTGGSSSSSGVRR
jgi:hypothetical protein